MPSVGGAVAAAQPARREFLKLGLGAVTAVAGVAVCSAARGPGLPAPVAFTPMAPPIIVSPRSWPKSSPTGTADVRRAFVHNLHTGEQFDAVYFEAGRYVPQALAEAMRVMRDWRNGAEHVMDPRLIDLLHGLGARVGSRRPFQLISGYRSPQTNAMLHAESGQVAAHSQHVLGKASDIRIEGVPLARLHAAVLSLKAGGVGFYPVSDFVHVDVGRVRQWSGS